MLDSIYHMTLKYLKNRILGKRKDAKSCDKIEHQNSLMCKRCVITLVTNRKLLTFYFDFKVILFKHHIKESNISRTH